MNLGYILSGAAPVKKRYKVGVTMTTAAGIPIMVATTADAGVIFLPATAITAVTDCVGVTLDTAAYSTTQSSTVEGLITVIINPDAVWRLHASGGAGAGVVLPVTTNDVANAGGTVIDKTGAAGSGDDDVINFLRGTGFATSGNNKGQSRVVTVSGSTTCTVLVPFTNTIAVGDEFIFVPWEVAGALGNLVWLTTNLDEARTNVAAASVGMTCGVVDIEMDMSDTFTARRNTYVHVNISDHILKDLTT